MDSRIKTIESNRLLKIIRAVKARDCLWNALSPEYAKRHILEKAWTEVSREVGQSENFCREKWRNVRTGFLRSIQNNIRIVPDESSNDFQAVRKKRFYLYEQMKFLLPSVEVLEIRKRKKSAQGFNGTDGNLDEEYSENTMMDDYRSVGKFEVNSENDQSIDEEQSTHDEQLQVTDDIDSKYLQLLKELDERDKSVDTDKDKSGALCKRQRTESENQQVATNSNTQNRFLEQTSTEAESTWKCYERESQQLLDFFRGNIDDILTLSKKNQRHFKRKLLELVEELHDAEEATQH